MMTVTIDLTQMSTDQLAALAVVLSKSGQWRIAGAIRIEVSSRDQEGAVGELEKFMDAWSRASEIGILTTPK